MLIKSFGLQVLENICVKKMTVPVLARALGLHLSNFETMMIDNNPTTEIVERLAELTKYIWVWGIREFSADEIWKWIADYSAAEPDSRITVTETPWSECHASIYQEIDPDPSDRREWLLSRGAVTLDCYRSTWVLKVPPPWNAADELRVLRWHPSQEHVLDDKMHTVWRWNPLKLPRDKGKPPARPLKKAVIPAVSMLPAMREMRKQKVAEYLRSRLLAGVTQVTTKEVAFAYHNRHVKNQTTLQVIRDELTSLGWLYDTSSKVWKPIL